MPWPFTSAPAPTLDSGIVTLPATLTTVPNLTSAANVCWPMGVFFANATTASQFVSLANNAGQLLMDEIEVAGNSTLHIPLNFPPMTGLKWMASVASGITGKIWGYQN